MSARERATQRFRPGSLNCERNGFTLIEIMVALLLLLILAAGFVPLFLQGLSQSSAVRNKSLATNIAREKMEQVRQLDYREIQEDKDNPSDPRNLSVRFGSSATVRDIPFSIDYSVPPPATAGALKQVTITVNWTPPPVASPAVITSLIHQQFVGPRGSKLAFTPVAVDPLGTPFSRLQGSTTATYDVAQADWALVLNNLNQVGMSKRNVYMHLRLVDDAGIALADYKIGSSYLNYSVDAGGQVNRVWFAYTFNAGPSFGTGDVVIPDGYWNAKAVIYNEYDEPGNVWNLRVRIENGAPATISDFTAIGQEDNQSIILSWVPGLERDRDHWVIQRDTRLEDGTWPGAWVTIEDELPPYVYTYTDLGNAAMLTHPYGNTELTNYYRYQIWGVDLGGLEGTPAPAEAQLPPLPTTTTTTDPTSTTDTTSILTTTTLPSTTTTTAAPTVRVQNTTNKQWAISIRNSAGTVVQTGTVKNGQTWTSGNLSPGDYVVTATEKSGTRTATFSMPLQSGQIVLTIAW